MYKIVNELRSFAYCKSRAEGIEGVKHSRLFDGFGNFSVPKVGGPVAPVCVI